MASFDHICARLCLMTKAAWSDDMPSPLTRPMLHRLVRLGALNGLVLRDTSLVESDLMERARRLLSRAKAVYLCLEVYLSQGYQVILPEDDLWPQRLYCLRDQMPTFLFASGNTDLLRRRLIAVAGSRDVSPYTLDAAGKLGECLAKQGWTMVCGGARGVDAAAQEGILSAGGSLIIVPAQPVYRLLAQEVQRDAYHDHRLLYLCDALPDDPFSAQRAISRNHMIYSLGEAAVVIAPRDGVGGSWRGAADCLHGHFAPVFVPSDKTLAGSGGDALIALGAKQIDLQKSIGPQVAVNAQMDLFSV